MYKSNIFPLYLFYFTSGTCELSPLSGVALSTSFTFTCEGWNDPDTPLTYEFLYGNSESKVLLYYRTLASGTNISHTFRLPPGEESDNYTLVVTAKIKDTLGSSLNQQFAVQVSELFLQYILISTRSHGGG